MSRSRGRAVASAVMVQVVAAAGHRCECLDDEHAATVGRCLATVGAATLLAVPRDLAVPFDEAWRLAVGELAAICEPCLWRHRRPNSPSAMESPR